MCDAGRQFPFRYCVACRVLRVRGTIVGMKNYSLGERITDEVRDALQEYPELARQLLFARGIKEGEEAHAFFNPNYDEHLHDPFLLKDMKKAAERVLSAMRMNDKIAVYSDYDADGIPGGVLLTDFFRRAGYTNFITYIPHRHNEGFGVNHDAVEALVAQGAKILLTIDCGISDAEEVIRANERGMEVIITDHHEVPVAGVPDAFAVVDAKQPGCKYPFKELCGSGVAFKLVQALLRLDPTLIPAGHEKWLLDMAGIATLSDMVSLTGENRVLARYGLQVLRKSPRPGLQKLLSKLRIKQQFLSEDDVTFMITPRINAASRMGVPMDAYKLLYTNDIAEAGMLTDHLHKINDERKGTVAAMVKEMKKHLDERLKENDVDVIVIGNPLWKPPLLGLAATAIVEAYGKPVFAWGRDNGDGIKGSCRSNGKISIIDLMNSVKDSLTHFGGHHASGGFGVKPEKIHTLEEELCSAYKQQKVGEEIIACVDAVLLLDDVAWSTWNIVDSFGPFGMGNPKPLFLFENVAPTIVRQFGKENNHLELTFKKTTGGIVKAIGFFVGPEDFEHRPKAGEAVNLIATMEKSHFGYSPELRLRIVDIT